MSLSVLTLTNGRPYAARFLAEFQQLATELGAEYVIAADGPMGIDVARKYGCNIVPLDLAGRTQENAIAPSVAECHGDWILRFDDDETCSPAMREWLLKREWERGTEKVYSFPYAWLWGDADHFLVSFPFWPDPHARLMPREMTAKWPVQSHGPNPFGVGTIVPVAHLHHKFLVRSFAERQATARHYDTYFPGAGTGEHYGNFTLPETHAKDMRVREVGHGDVMLNEWIGQGEPVKIEGKVTA
jgi:hypothetical protein